MMGMILGKFMYHSYIFFKLILLNNHNNTYLLIYMREIYNIFKLIIVKKGIRCEKYIISINISVHNALQQSIAPEFMGRSKNYAFTRSYARMYY